PRCRDFSSLARSSGVTVGERRSPIFLTSPPAQNAPPAPVSRITRIDASSLQCFSILMKPCDIGADKAVFASGRLNVRVATPSLTLHSRSVVPVSRVFSALIGFPNISASAIGRRELLLDRLADRNRTGLAERLDLRARQSGAGQHFDRVLADTG